jgi:membrane-associated protease RseP (regulator of RpoE activity)
VLVGLIKVWQNLPEFISSEAALSFFYSSSFFVVVTIIFRAAMINLGLFIFNLFPIPPLDGSHIVFSGLNLSHDTEIRIMKIGGPLLFIILIIQNTTGVTILPIGRLISAILNFLL